MFKFYSFDENDYWKTPFIQKQIHFDSFANFNDSFEGFFVMTGDGDFNTKYTKLNSWSPGNSYLQSLDTLEKINTYLSPANFNANRAEFIRTLAEHGVSCFSKDCSQILMWAHYARKQSGFCLEFDARVIQDAGTSDGLHFQDVVYVDEIPKHSIFEDQPLEHLLKYKYKDWHYEKECRAIKNSPGLLAIPEYGIKSITLGEKFLGTPRSTELKNIIDQHTPHLRDSVKLISRSREKYELNVRPLDWIMWP